MENTVESGMGTEEKIKFFKKYERFLNLAKKFFLVLLFLNLIFWLIYIPIKDENINPLFAVYFLLFLFTVAMITNSKKSNKIFFLSGVLIFIFSYFITSPFLSFEKEEIVYSFITNSEEKLIKYGDSIFFHIPYYQRHFNYKVNQRRELKNEKDETKLIINLKFYFDEIFVEKDRLNDYSVSRKYFDKFIDKEIALLKLNIERYGTPKKLSDLKNINKPWLKITSLEINFKLD